jgi:hypothetical protein
MRVSNPNRSPVAITELEAGKVRDLKPEALKRLAAQAVDAKRRS